MDILFLAIKQLTISILFIAVFLGLGRLILKILNLQFHSAYEEYFFSSITGSAVSIMYVTILSLFGVAYKPLFLVLVIGLYGLKYFKINKKEIMWLILIFLILMPAFILTLYPPTACDATTYHLPIAESILKNHKLVLNENLRYPVLPLNGNMLFVLGLSFNVITAQLISWIFLFILSVGCFSEVEKKYSKIGGLIAFILLVSNLFIIKLGTIAYIDTILITFILGAVIALINFFKKNHKSWLYISGLLLGIAIGTKYSALIFFIMIIIAFIVLKKWLFLIQYSFITMIFGIIWYIRNFYYTGNPIWPVFSYTPFWNITDYRIQLLDYDIGGISKTFFNFINLPWHLAHDHIEKLEVVDPIIWLGVIITIFFLSKKRDSLIFLAISGIYTIAWFYSINFARYYALNIPFLAIISGIGLMYFISKINNDKLKFALVTFILIYGLYDIYGFIYKQIEFFGPPPTSVEQTDKYLSSQFPEYKAVKKASELDGKTYFLGYQGMYFYGKEKVMVQYVGKARQHDVYNLLEKPDSLHSHLKKLNADYLILQLDYLSINPNWKKLNEKEIMNRVKLNNLFTKLYEDDKTILYKLK